MAVGGGRLVDRPAQVQLRDDGRRPQVEGSKTIEVAVWSCSTGTVSVPKHSTATLTGRATPMAYASCTSQRLARPAATRFFATHLPSRSPSPRRS